MIAGLVLEQVSDRHRKSLGFATGYAIDFDGGASMPFFLSLARKINP
jgi:hypothetical protein